MSSCNILDLPDECLLIILHHLDAMSQCQFGVACGRFEDIYEMEHKNDFRSFTWCKTSNKWTDLQIKAFFKLNGHKMQSLIVSVTEFSTQLTNTNNLIGVCLYLKNLRLLILSVNRQINDMIIAICEHCKELKYLTIDHSDLRDCPNYECLVELPKLSSLDIPYFNKNSSDKVFQRFAELCPDGLEYLHIGSTLKREQIKYIAYFRCLKMLNIYKPDSYFVHHCIVQLSNLTVLCLTNAKHLQSYNFRHIIFKLKFLSKLYIQECHNFNYCSLLFIARYLNDEVMIGVKLRHLPFYLDLTGTAVSKQLNGLIRKCEIDVLLIRVVSCNLAV